MTHPSSIGPSDERPSDMRAVVVEHPRRTVGQEPHGVVAEPDPDADADPRDARCSSWATTTGGTLVVCRLVVWRRWRARHPPAFGRRRGPLAVSRAASRIRCSSTSARSAIGEAAAAGDPASATRRAEASAREAARRLLGPVINATGVLLHTNLGRAPLGRVDTVRATRTSSST